MTKNLTRLIISGILLLVMGIALVAADLYPSAFFEFYSDASRKMIAVPALATSVVPFAVCEVLVVVAVVSIIVTLVRAVRDGRMIRWLTGVLLAVVTVVFTFVMIWGLNYYAPPMAQQLDMQERQFTVSQLREAAEYYRDMANAAAKNVERDENGAMRPYAFDALSEQAGEGYERLAQRYDCFNGSTVRVKSLFISPLMGKMSMTGGFICLTGEACVSSTTYCAAMPFTMCHEIGHRMAFAREDEANFAAFLACVANERPEFVYSGYYMAFKYCYNALSKVDPAAASKVWAGVSAELAADCGASAKHYESVRSEAVSNTANKVYDGYLNAFSVENGVQSYGEVADLLILWYFDEVM